MAENTNKKTEEKKDDKQNETGNPIVGVVALLVIFYLLYNLVSCVFDGSDSNSNSKKKISEEQLAELRVKAKNLSKDEINELAIKLSNKSVCGCYRATMSSLGDRWSTTTVTDTFCTPAINLLLVEESDITTPYCPSNCSGIGALLGACIDVQLTNPEIGRKMKIYDYQAVYLKGNILKGSGGFPPYTINPQIVGYAN